MAADVTIAVRNLSKEYRIGSMLPGYRILATRMFRSRGDQASADVTQPRRQLLKALDDVSFEVREGEVVGIVGRNGAGKSTLLKILSRITEPTSGSATLHGRVSSLLEVGTGFHPELTGRENVFLNGAILGMSKQEIRSLFDEIVAFSEIETFIDTPVKRYSSGMYVRLAFAVAAHLSPEIMIVDEVLAVGDVAFQRKCLGKMQDAARSGRTVLFVSHNTGAVQSLCTRGILLENGRMTLDGDTASVIKAYLSRLSESGGSGFVLTEPRDVPVQVTQIELLDEAGDAVAEIELGSDVIVQTTYRIDRRLRDVSIALLLSGEGTPLLYSYDVDVDESLRVWREPGTYTTRVQLPTRLFKEGSYRVELAVGWSKENLTDPAANVSFEVVNTMRDTTHRSFKRERPGLMFSELPWDTQAVDRPAQSPTFSS